MKTAVKKKIGKPPRAKIDSVTVTDKAVEVMFTGVRLVGDYISAVRESNFEGQKSYQFCAGLEIPESKELDNLIKTIRTHFKGVDMKGFHADVALEHFDEKKFKPSNNAASRILWPTSNAEETDEGFKSTGKFFVNPSHDAFYAGCYVDAKVAFVANIRGGITIKDYLNAVRFNADGEPISGAVDPWGGSAAGAVVTKVHKAQEDAPKSTRRSVKKK